MSMDVTQDDIDAQAARLLADATEGEALDAVTRAVLEVALRASAMALDVAGTREGIHAALAVGATRDQLQEAITLVSGMGVHAFFEASRSLAEITDARPETWDDRRQELWDRYVGDRAVWRTMKDEIPGFLEDLLALSPEAFEAFFAYCAVPFRSTHLTTLQKELISVAVDACPSHRYLPGMRMHIRNALSLGAGRTQIEDVLAVASSSPSPSGVR
jgi:alkylhydroperoxidase/carboxymuconolactone decarboxylase family protein YurZ